MPWAEVYSALQMQAIDAAEAQHPATYGSRLFEVVKHVTKTGHIQLITGLVGSKIWFDKLPPEQQTILKEEALKAGEFDLMRFFRRYVRGGYSKNAEPFPSQDG